MMNLLPYLQLLRPKQWIKNVFILLPLFFSSEFTNIDKLVAVCTAFVAFSMVSSAIYCLNDIIDREADRAHEKKRHRPIASGAVSVASACVCMAVCLGIALCMLWLLPQGCMASVALVLGIYAVMNVAYCLYLKRIAIVDVFCISIGFVLRVLTGGYSADVEPSSWIVLMTFLLALFMALAKRRDDVSIFQATGVITRKNIVGYNLPFMNISLAAIAAVTMMCYVMYTMSPEVMQLHNSRMLYLTSVFVLAALLRYLQITIVYERSGSPTEVVLHDAFLQGCLLGWIVTFALIIY